MADLTPPQAPSQLTCSVIDVDNSTGRATVAVGWMDNCDFPDEFVTNFRFEAEDGSPMTTQAVYASDYDTPPGSTGTRSGQVVIPAPNGPFSVSAACARWITMDDGAKFSVFSEYSATVIVDPVGGGASGGKTHGKGNNKNR